MTFLSTLALAIALLVVVPYAAHRLRRRRSDVLPFAAIRLLDPSPPAARRRSRVEDVPLFFVRAAAILVLALLGASPFVRCARQSIERPGGASVALAIVLDDSMSMRVRDPSGKTRFDRARESGIELLGSARDGDAVAVVLAGTPVRVALAATSDLEAARRTLADAQPSDRGTDLDRAASMATELLGPLPQVDKRIAVFSDLADGHVDSPPFGEGSSVPIWLALPELRGFATDCAVLTADRVAAGVRVEVACGPGATAKGRVVTVEDASGKSVGHAVLGADGVRTSVSVRVSDAPRVPLVARLDRADAIAADDVAPVLDDLGRTSIAIVADTADETPVTGGAPVVEQALAALMVDIDVRPMLAFPDTAADLGGAVGVLIDDPPGFTPEQRHALAGFIRQGGGVLVALGPRAAGAPLGASFEPVLANPVAWRATDSRGADPARVTGALAPYALSLADLGAPRRAELSNEDRAGLEAFANWTDGAPLVARRTLGRGEAWLVSLPFSIDASDLPLRPGFLALMDGWVQSVRQRGVATRVSVGGAWTWTGAERPEIRGGRGTFSGSRTEGLWRFEPAEIGAYSVTVDGRIETRVAMPDVREIDLRPRAVSSLLTSGSVGHGSSTIDASPALAWALLGLWAAELTLRVWSRRRLQARPLE